ncbi:peptidase C13 family protein [Teladorsagia circumcincta]|uniref:Peptidase C13 family protein n=1 Tax=Teladorsagia circumcincta TaxID=45464 RepID=A0A2G9V161_TELCI|nr:peptidase C13 family protein [Teladorsagia circumcincta]
MRILLLFFSLVLLSFTTVLSLRHHRQPAAEGEIHALLVAGSNGWYNYRHQADVGHAYHTLKRHGLADENIIVMMYDDIAKNQQNPYPGKMFNKPHGDDVYKGLKIDYKVGAQFDLKGLFQLTVKELNSALKWMHANNRYDQLVFYLESCESGSMFENVLKSNINVYAITAANSHESSWGTFCENDMRLPCLGDLFSVNWMKDSDEEDLNVETLEHQYELVKRMTNLSHVMHFGDMHIANEPVGWFQGQRKVHRKKIDYIDEKPDRTVSWPSRDVELMYLHQLKYSTNDIYEVKELNRRIRKIHEDRRGIKSLVLELTDNLVETLADRRRMFEERNTVEDLDCHDEVVRAFDLICVDINKYDYALKYIYVLNNLCIEFGNAEQIIAALWTTCSRNRFKFF